MWNVTFDKENKQFVIYIRTPYHKDYLSVHNQEFQLHISSARSNTVTPNVSVSLYFDCSCCKDDPLPLCPQTQNVSSKDFLAVDIGHFQKGTKYHVKVRAIPQTFQGSWSKWSDTFSFFPPAGENDGPIS